MLKYLRHWLADWFCLGFLRRHHVPSTETTGKSAMEPLSASLIPHILLPERQVRAVVAVIFVRKRGAEHGKGRVVFGFKSRARAFVGHFGIFPRYTTSQRKLISSWWLVGKDVEVARWVH